MLGKVRHGLPGDSQIQLYSQPATMPEKHPRPTQALPVLPPWRDVKDCNTNEGSERPGPWGRLIEEYLKNHCSQTSPPLVLPTPPSGTENHRYVQMNRKLQVSCGIVTLLSLGVGAWMFAKASPIYSWYAVYIFVSEFYLFTSLFITIIGKELDLDAHEELCKSHAITEGDAPTVDNYLPVCKEPLERLENTWKYIAAIQYPVDKLSVFVLDDGADDSIRLLAKRFEFS